MKKLLQIFFFLAFFVFASQGPGFAQGFQRPQPVSPPFSSSDNWAIAQTVYSGDSAIIRNLTGTGSTVTLAGVHVVNGRLCTRDSIIYGGGGGGGAITSPVYGNRVNTRDSVINQVSVKITSPLQADINTSEQALPVMGYDLVGGKQNLLPVLSSNSGAVGLSSPMVPVREYAHPVHIITHTGISSPAIASTITNDFNSTISGNGYPLTPVIISDGVGTVTIIEYWISY